MAPIAVGRLSLHCERSALLQGLPACTCNATSRASAGMQILRLAAGATCASRLRVRALRWCEVASYCACGCGAEAGRCSSSSGVICAC